MSELDKSTPALASLAVYDKVMLCGMPLLSGSLFLAAFVAEQSSEITPCVLRSLSCVIGCGTAIARTRIPEQLRLALYNGALLLLGASTLVFDGLWGQGLPLIILCLISSPLAKPRTRRFIYGGAAFVVFVSAAIHIGGWRRGSSLSPDSASAWIPALATLLFAGVFTYHRARHSELMQEREHARISIQNRFLSAFHLASDPILQIRNGLIVEANKQALACFGYTKAELISMSPIALAKNSGTNTESIEEAKQRYVNAGLGHPQRFCWTMLRKNGEEFQADVFAFLSTQNHSDLVIAVIRDISRERRLESEHRMLALAIEQAGEAVAITDTTGKIEYINRAFEQITGYSREESLGKDHRILKSGAHDNAYYQKLWSTISSGKCWTGQMVNLRKDGRRYTEDASITPLRNSSGVITHYVAVKRDITRELELENRLNHSQKMEAVGRLAGGIAHDFNNIIQIIIGNVNVASDSLSPTHPSRESIQAISNAADRATGLVRQLLTFSRKTEIKMRPLELNLLLNEACRMIQRLIGEDISLSFRPCPKPLTILADQGQLEQVLINLCANARDAMAASGGRITIETHELKLDETFCELQPGTKPGLHACISVSDTGCGISPENRARIFEPFFTTKEAGKGTGLGLASVYAIIHRHNGTINLQSEIGVGTSFTIYLPLIEAKVSTQESALKEDRDTRPGQNETILLAEDDPQVLSIATLLLTRAGYKVIGCRDGQEALERHADTKERIHLAILDVLMPRCNGRQAYEELKRRDPNLPVIFATGYSSHHLDSEIRQKTLVLNKPYTKKELLASIRTAMGSN